MLNAQPIPSNLLASALVSTPDRQLFASRDLQETCAMVGRVMKPHQLVMARPEQMRVSPTNRSVLSAQILP